MLKSVERMINKIYTEVFKKVFSKSMMSKAMTGDKKAIEKAVFDLEKSKKFEEFAKEFSKKLAAKGLSSEKGLWKKYFEAAKKKHYHVLPSTYSEFEKKILREAIEHNFKMIKSIPSHVLEVYQHKYTETLIQQVAEGKIGRRSFERQLASHGHKNAKVIARTETAKLQTAILENRSRDLGSIAYIWRSSHDIRTRTSHRLMNDVVVFWRKDSEKPKLDNMQGNAGEFPNCRCTPQPILDETDLKKSKYRVYDYTQHKVVTLERNKLIELLKKGGF